MTILKRVNFYLIVLLSIISLVFVACMSKTLEGIDELGTASLKMVNVRNLIEQTRYRVARLALQQIRDDYPSSPELLIEIDYEEAYIDLSQKKYIQAKEKFEAIIQSYEGASSGSLPQWPLYLSRKLVEENINVILDKKQARIDARNEKKAARIKKQEEQKAKSQIATQQPVATPAESATDETPAESAIDETPTESATDETPAESAIDETPTESTIDETPAESTADETPAESSTDSVEPDASQIP